ncbi:MAG: SCO family protein [Gammaproteobacteria bacterium]|nr:SCO family protein [Gammaproteobacteria bacterium]
MNHQKRKVPKALYLVVIAVITLATLSQWVIWKYGNIKNNTQIADDGIAATILYQPAPITSFRLSNQKGSEFNQDSFLNHWSLLTFGYTNCPDICPTTLQTLNHVDKLLKESNYPIQPQVVFISLDPERDNVEKLAEYIPWFNEDFIGLTGSIEQVEVLTKMLGIINKKRDTEPRSNNYQIDHTVAIMMIDSKAQLRALSSAPHNAQTIAEDFIKITQKFN